MDSNNIDIKKIETDILCSVADFCDKNNITYYLAYGTLIGAVRHKGFIPWDDDIDIMMPREDYIKFFESFEAEKLKAICCENDKGYYLPFGKVIDTRTELIEDVVIDYKLGVYIDVFPLDFLSSYEIKNKIVLWKLLILRDFLMLKVLPDSNRRKGIRKQVHKIMSILFKNIDNNRISYKMNNLSKRLSKKDKISKKYLSVLSNNDSREMHLRFDSNWFNKKTSVEFEGNTFSAPNDYDLVLKLLYGDYMQLPPIEEQTSHHIFSVRLK